MHPATRAGNTVVNGQRGNRAQAREKLRDQHHMIGVKNDSFVLIG